MAIFKNFRANVVDPARLRRQIMALIGTWNMIQGESPLLGLNRLTPLPREWVGVPASSFNPSFLVDLDRYKATITGKVQGKRAGHRVDETCSAAPVKSFRRDSTASNRVSDLRAAAVKLALASGIPLTSITYIADLLAPGAPTTIMEELYEIHGDTLYLRNVLVSLTVSEDYRPLLCAVWVRRLSRRPSAMA